jgi:hypothetical protein
LPAIRRVVTAHAPDGRSHAAIDGPATVHETGSGGRVYDIWESPSVPVLLEPEERDPTEGPLHFAIPETGIRVRIADLAPASADAKPFIHRTEAIDYVLVLEGEVTMLFDDEEHQVVLKKNDWLIQRGTLHAWVNRTDKPCRILFVIVAARYSEELQKLTAAAPAWNGKTARH